METTGTVGLGPGTDPGVGIRGALEGLDIVGACWGVVNLSVGFGVDCVEGCFCDSGLKVVVLWAGAIIWAALSVCCCPFKETGLFD